MTRGYLTSICAAAALLAAPAASQAATVLNLGPTANPCGVDGCFSAEHTYEHTWSASDLAGATSIGGLMLDKALLGSLVNQAVRITFQNAAGETVANWGAFTVAVLGGNIVLLGAPEALDWDAASMGDLTIKLEALGLGGRGGIGGGAGFGGFASRGGAGAFGGGPSAPVFRAAPAPPPTPPAMVQALLQPQLVSVPEPGAWALMVTGFLGAGAMLRRKPRTLPAV